MCQDPNGNTVRMVPVEKTGDYVGAMDALNSKYVDLLQKLAAHQRSFNEVLEKEVGLELWEIKLSEMPDLLQ